MKKLEFYLIASLLAVFSFTSCLETNNVTEGQGVGVLEYNNGSYLILKSNMGDLYANNLEALVLDGNMTIGNCYHFAYRHDADLPENSPAMIELYEFETISLLEYIELPKYYSSGVLTDISTALDDEVPLLDVYNSGNPYIDNYFFIRHIVNQQSDLELNWNLTYDYENIVTEVNGVRYYDIYVRATAINSTNKTSKAETVHLNAYNIGTYMINIAVREKSILGGSYNPSTSRFNLRFNYVSAINEETREITWSNKVITDIYLSPFLYE